MFLNAAGPINWVLSPTAVTVVTSPTALLTEAQANTGGLRAIGIQPTGGDIYIGDPSVTSSTGIKITDGTFVLLPKTRAILYAISAGSVSTHILLGGE